MTQPDDQQNPFEDLIVGHFDGKLSADQELQLAKTITESPESKRVFLSYMRLEGRLHSLGHDGFLNAAGVEDVDATVQPVGRKVDSRSENEPHSKRSRLLAASSLIATCCGLMALLSWGLWPSSVNASDVLQRAQRAAAEQVDRAYRVTIVNSNRAKDITNQELMIHIRGDRLFVIEPTDGSYLMGRDGSDFWMTSRDGPVWITKDYRLLAPELKRKIPNRRLLGIASSPNEPLMMQMSSVLSAIETFYDVQLMDSSDAGEHHIKATRSRGGRNRPDAIEVWANEDSGVVVRADMKWSNDDRLTRFELVNSPVLTDGWYQYSQHAPDREVMRLEATH